MITWNDVISFANNGNPEPPRTVDKSESEWKEILTTDEYRIMREKGTERAFSGEGCRVFELGTYACAGCDEKLFDSNHKFKSGSGWPSFSVPIKYNVIRYEQDDTHSMKRVEVSCNVCGGHLGHVFPDGPPPSGLRFCVNSVSLTKLS